MVIQHPTNWIGIIDNAFAVYRKQLRLFIAIALIYSIVNWVIGYFTPYLWANNVYEWLSDITSELFYEWMLGVFVVAATQAYLNKQITPKNAFIQVTQVYPRYLTSQLIYITLSMMPSFAIDIMAEVAIIPVRAYIIPVLLIRIVCTYVLTTWRLYPPVIIVEDTAESPMKLKPINRSNKLVKNSWWRIFGTLFALKTLLRAIRLLCVVSAILIIGACGLMGKTKTRKIAEFAIRAEFGFYYGYTFPLQLASTIRHLLRTLSVATSILTKPIFAIGITLIYFNQKNK